MTSRHNQALHLRKECFDFFFFAGDKEFAVGMTYTALSRARKFENLAFDPMPSVERIKRVSNYPTFKKRLKEDVILKKLQDQTEREAEIEGIATDDSDDESDESTFLADMDIDADMTSNWEHVQDLPTSQTSQHLSTWPCFLQILSDGLIMQFC